MSDFAAGNYASVADDIAGEFTAIADLLRGFLGVAAGPGDADDLAAFQMDADEFLLAQRGKAFVAVGAFDANKWLAAFEALLATLSSIWSIFHPPTV